jgi:hypothetical protein
MLGLDQAATESEDLCSRLSPLTLAEGARVWDDARAVHMAC